MKLPLVPDDDFASRVLASPVPVVVEFFQTGCSKCRALEPELEALADAWDGKAQVVKVDVDRSSMFEQYELLGTPTVLVFRNGALKFRLDGVVARARLEAILREFV